MACPLQGLYFAAYRSFGEQGVALTNLEKVNVIIGQNNSGKSNILRALVSQYQLITGGLESPNKQRITGIDQPVHHKDRPVTVGVLIHKNSELAQNIIDNLKSNIVFSHPHKERIKQRVFQDREAVWVYRQKERKNLTSNQYCMDRFTSQYNLDDNGWLGFARLFEEFTGGHKETWVRTILDRFDPFPHMLRKVDVIPAVRSLENYSREGLTQTSVGQYVIDGISDHSGIGLIQELFKLQQPAFGNEADMDRFQKINSFVREITGNSSAKISIPHDTSMIIVEMDDKRLPLEALGTGIQEVVIIAAKSTIFDSQIVCIEEPELHLHPTLQRKLVKYLYENTNNQYFITTHSAHLMDACPCSIYHISLKKGYSVINTAIHDADKFEICKDLGYKSSDIFQSNSIIWVEGPSDRIYLNHWIHDAAPDLVEGLHYSIMFYGGRLLAHLTAHDTEIEEFIRLQRINRNMAIVIDSDRTKKGQPISATKRRIRAEFTNNKGYCWVTSGCEIENYIPSNLLQEAITACHPNIGRHPRAGQYEKVTRYKAKMRKKGTASRNDRNHKSIDKVKVAHHVCDEPANLSVLDLADKIKDIVEFVRKANLIAV